MGFFLGLDLGKLADHAALVVDEVVRGDSLTPLREMAKESGFEVDPMSVGHVIRAVKQWPLNTDYTQIARELKQAVEKVGIQGATCVVEVNGPGVGVLEILHLFQVPLNLVPVMTTGGMVTTTMGSDEIVHVGKSHLVGIVQSALQGRRIHIAPGPYRDTLVKELELFGVEITKSGNEKFEAIGEAHDDLVMACAFALWAGETFGDPKNASDHFTSVLYPGGVQRKLVHANGIQTVDKIETAVFGRMGRPDRADDPFRKGMGREGGAGRQKGGFIDPIHRRDKPF